MKLSILHAGDTAPVEYSIVREKVTVPAVSWSMIPGTTLADLRLEEFSAGSAKEVEDAIVAAKKAGATGIVLDLRGNPGGYVGEAVDIASQFLKDGVVYQQRDKSGKVEKEKVKPGGEATSIPLTVLVDLGTASSAEIVAGAIQDAGRGQAHRVDDVRDRHRPQRVLAERRLGPPRRDRRVAHPRRAPDLEARASSRTSRSSRPRPARSSRRASCRSWAPTACRSRATRRS